MTHCEKCSALKTNVDNGLKVLQNCAWLLDSYTLDYHAENHWMKLPEQWRQILDEVEPQELGELLDPANVNGSLQRVWPLSFLALRSASVQLSLSRQQSELYTVLSQSNGGESVKECVLHEMRTPSNCNDIKEPTSTSKVCLFPTHSELAHVFIKHVKPKKRHEITTMAQVAADMAQARDCQFIVDVGSGLGHLARTLAYGYGLRVCCLESQDALSEQARKLDVELEVSVSKRFSAEDMTKFHRPVHLNITVESKTDPLYFVKAFSKAFDNVGDAPLKFGIVGLHPCGDLGPILLQLFINCPNATFINIVGCCYMKLSIKNEITNHFKGYPMSDFVSKRPHVLSYEARGLACHAIENYCLRLRSGDIYHLKVHCYRATLERILVKYWPEFRHSGIRSIKHAHRMSFDDYCAAAISKLGVELPQEEMSCEETQDNLAQWKRVVTLYSLRLMMAPLVETIVLLDRLLYLQELGISSVLIPVFNPSLSPRNHILVAAKPLYK